MDSMKHLLVTVLVTFALPPSLWASHAREPSKEATKFAMDMLSKVQQEKRETNTVESPLSLQIALSMLYAGVKGSTKKEMKKALGVKSSAKNYLAEFGRFIDETTLTGQLKIASNVFVSERLELFQNYTNLIEQNYGPAVRQVDFDVDLSNTAIIINRWCSEATEGLIRKLVSARDLQGAVMMIVNAIHFKAKWDESVMFEPRHTKVEEFTTFDHRTVRVHMMDTVSPGIYPYNIHYDALNAQILQLNYGPPDHRQNQRFRMIIILPNIGSDVLSILNLLNGSVDIKDAVASLEPSMVKVKIPKFSHHMKIDMKQVLTKMGMGSIFSRSTNFGRMTDNKDLVVSKVIQKAVIEVTEEGTEAAAVTTMHFALTSSKSYLDGRYEFTANRSFIFFIMPADTVVPIFQGVVMSPKFKG